MTLIEAVLRKITIKEYYARYIVDIEEWVEKKGERFKKNYKYGFNNQELAVCPLHDDRDPSFGLMNSKKYKGVVLYHCFGCGKVGDVIRLHQRMINLRKIDIGLPPNSNITYNQAAELLAKDLGIEEKNLQEEKVDLNNEFVKKKIDLIKSMDSYTIRDFENELLRLRLGDFTYKNKKILLNRQLIKLSSK